MKIQIRTGMFETNSSSAHSLLIMKKCQIMTQKEIRDEFYLDEDWCKDRNNILQLDSYGNNYGRGFDVLASFRDKLSYALASVCGSCYTLTSYIEAGDRFERKFAPLLKRLIGVDEIKIPTDYKNFNVYSDTITGDEYQDYETYAEVPYDDLVYNENHEDGLYKETCKSGRKQEAIWLNVPDFGSVDHQSAGLFQGFLKKYGITLEEYLTRKDIVVVIDGDELCIFGTMLDSGLIDEDAIQIIYSSLSSYNKRG